MKKYWDMGESNMNFPWIKMSICKNKLEVFNDAPNKINKKFIDTLSISWAYFMKDNASLGFLFDKNTYKDDFTGGKIRLLHVTPSIEKLKRSGKINSSGGGLGSVIYCSPLHKDFTPHNLFNLYSEFQLPKKIKKDKIGAICIEINSKPNINKLSSWGVDYTLFGKIHCNVWKDIKLKSDDKKYFQEVEEGVLNRIKKNSEYLNKLISYKMENVNLDEFRHIYRKIFMEFPELRFILYEVIAEYILLNQNDNHSLMYASKGEIFNQNHKKLIWDLCPTMLKKFNMKEFFISLDELSSYLNKKKIILNFDEGSFYNWIKWRTSYYFLKIGRKLIKNTIRFEDLLKKHSYLTGQILYREFYDKHLFEISRSKYLYKIWKKNKLIIPIYPIIAKGEMGVNPNLDELNIKYSICEVRVINNKVKLGKQLNIKISPDMIKKEEATVR